MTKQQWSEDERQHAQWLVETAAHSYYAEVTPRPLHEQSALIEQLIELAFGNLGAQHLEVRVTNQCYEREFSWN